MQARKTLSKKKMISNAKFFDSVEIYKPITLLGKIVGYPLIGYGVATLWHPFSASIFAIIGGCALVGIDYKKFMKSLKFYGKKLINWAYANRSWKLIKRTIKARFM